MTVIAKWPQIWPIVFCFLFLFFSFVGWFFGITPNLQSSNTFVELLFFFFYVKTVLLSLPIPWKNHFHPFLPPLLLAVLSFLHFFLSVSDLASFLLSLFHSSDGKLISTVWTQTGYQTQTQLRIAQGLHPFLPSFPSSLPYPPQNNPYTCLHAPLLQWKKAALIPPFCPLFLPCVLSPGGHSAGGVWWVGGDSDRESQRALHLLASHLYRHWAALRLARCRRGLLQLDSSPMHVHKFCNCCVFMMMIIFF